MNLFESINILYKEFYKYYDFTGKTLLINLSFRVNSELFH